jgi:hypothetical protein
MALTNRQIIDRIKSANKYIRTLKQQGLELSGTARKLEEAASRSAPGSKPRVYFAGERIKLAKPGTKKYQQQRKQLLRTYEEIKLHEQYLQTPVTTIKATAGRNYAQTERAKAIRQSLVRKYGIAEEQLTDQFFEFVNTDDFQRFLESTQNHESAVMDNLIFKISGDISILDDLDLLTIKIREYMADPSRDEFVIEHFDNILEHFRD